MKAISWICLMLALGPAAPAYAQSGGATGDQPVAGQGPGGSGAGEPSAGASKTPPSAPAAASTAKTPVPADEARPAAKSTTN